MRECIDRFGNLIWSIARRMTSTRADAKVAVQEIFTDVWRSAGCFDPEQGSEEVFVAIIARRRLIDRKRGVAHRHRTRSIDNVVSPGWADADNRADVCAEALAAARAAMQLRSQLRRVLDLGILQGLSHSAIAHQLQLPLDIVKTMMTRGLIQVREFMGSN